MKTGSPSVPSSRRRYQLRARKVSIDKFAAWQKEPPRYADSARMPADNQRANRSVAR